MKYWKSLIACALLLSCLAGLMAGCGGEKSTTEPTQVSSEAAASAASAAGAAETTAAAPAEQTEHITQQLSENLLIDADVVLPAKAEYRTYTMALVNTDPDRLFSIFCPDGYGTYTTVDSGYMIYQESSGKKLVIHESSDYSSISYKIVDIDSDTVSAETKTIFQEMNDLLYYHTQEYPQAEAHDLSFMTVTEMEEYGRTLLNQVGSALEPELFRCTTLSGQELLDFQQEILSKEEYADSLSTILTEAQDVCYLEYRFTCDGLPLLGPEEPSVTKADSWSIPQAVKATITITADGLQEFTLTVPCVVQSSSEPQTVLTLEEASEKLKEKYDLEILYSEYKISEIWMEYIPVIRDDAITLEPYWCFKSVADGMEGYSDYYGDADRFNAITGEDLAYED